jgi:hypothetical protein
VTEQVEGGIRLDPVKGKLTPLEILTHNTITPKKKLVVSVVQKKKNIYMEYKSSLYTTNAKYVNIFE